jgi:hypothetical protein
VPIQDLLLQLTHALQAGHNDLDQAQAVLAQLATVLEDPGEPPPFQPMLPAPPRHGRYRVRVRLSDGSRVVSYARWTGSEWYDALPIEAIEAWSFPGQEGDW